MENIFFENFYKPGPSTSAISAQYRHNLFRNEINIKGDYQIRWLIRVLNQSRKDKVQVWFISHIFPTAGETTSAYNTMMSSIFWDYKDVIRYQFYGHSHNDQFILYQHNDEIYGLSLIHI